MNLWRGKKITHGDGFGDRRCFDNKMKGKKKWINEDQKLIAIDECIGVCDIFIATETVSMLIIFNFDFYVERKYEIMGVFGISGIRRN